MDKKYFVFGYLCATTLLISYLVLIGFLCWLFHSGWFALMIFAMPIMNFKDK